jgi:hypothetical protein
MATRRVDTGTSPAKRARQPRRRAPEATTPAPPTAARAPSHAAIAARAHALFPARGGQDGDDWADWFQAEAELCAEGPPSTE